MQSKLLDDGGQKQFTLIFETGDEIVPQLLAFAREHRVRGAHFTAIGALSDVVLGYFDWEKKEYLRNSFAEQVEVVSLIGDIALDDKGEPQVHAHIVVGRRDGSALGGHLLDGHVRPTLELILEESRAPLVKKWNAQARLALIDVSRG